MASSWLTDLGVHQGRIAASNAPEGAYVYELGHALGSKRRLRIGDYHEVAQTVVLDPAARLLRCQLRITAPLVIPGGFGWLITGRLNGAVVASRAIPRGARPFLLTDMAISLVSALGPPTPDVIAFRLEVTA